MKTRLLAITILGAIISTPTYASDLYIKNSSKYGCIDKDYFDKTIEMVAQGDREAFAKILGAGIATGVCTMFTANEPVYLVKSGILTIKIRRKGDVAEYWVDTQSVTVR